MENRARWALSREAKVCMLTLLDIDPKRLAELLNDPDAGIREMAARHPAVNPQDLMQALENHPELQTASVPAFLLWQWMQENKK